MPNLTEHILQQVQDGSLDIKEAQNLLAQQAQEALTQNLGFARIDHDRKRRVGAAEVIFGEGKTPEQVIAIAQQIKQAGSDVLITRANQATINAVTQTLPDFIINPIARTIHHHHHHHENTNQQTSAQTAHHTAESESNSIAIVCAGTSDLPVAEEARVTAEFYGNTVHTYYDCGVAGLHRLLEVLPQIRQAKTIVAVAGMEGALPSVLAGLVSVPVFAVPTSVGYGANFQGLTALLAMLNSCASGISVVNIDNGFGAAYNANQVIQLITGK